MIRNKVVLMSVVPIFLSLVACRGEPAPPSPTPPPPTVTPLPPPAPTPTSLPMAEPPPLPLDLSNVGVLTPTLPVNMQTIYSYTYQKPNGNRLAAGAGRMTSVQPIDIALDGIPAWVVGVPVDGGGSIWSAVLEDGRVKSFFILAGTVTPIVVRPEKLPAGMPPLLVIYQGVPMLVTGPAEDASPLTHPVVLGDDPSNLAYIAANGDLVVQKGGSTTRLDVDALPDARILQDGRGRLLLLSGPTGRYGHGVLGDGLEASSITLVETDPVRVAQVISTGDQVVEGIAPLWADLDDDGDWEIAVTLSDDEMGARIVLFNEQGERVAGGPAIGRGYRWRHQLVAAPFEGGPNLTLVDNLTPHIGGVTEFYLWDKEIGLVVQTSIPGFSTHRLGSRNMDMALAADLDGDGVIELLLPSQSRVSLGALRVQNGFAAVAWTIDLGANLATNIAGVTLLDGSLAIGLGLESGVLRLWLP